MKQRSSFVRIILIWTVTQFILLLLFFNLGTWYIFLKLRESTDEELGKHLVNYASMISNQIKTKRVEDEPIEITIYRGKLDKELDRLTIELGLSNICVIDTLGTLLYSYDRTLQLFRTYPYIIIDKAAFESAREGAGTDTKLYEKKGKYLKSAFYPIFDTNNKVAGIVVIEAGSEFFSFIANLKRYAVLLSGITGLTIVLLGLFFLFVLKRLKKAEESVMRSVALSTMGEMVSIVSHEIRNPLGIMRAAIERLTKKLKNKDEIELAGYLKDEIERVNGLVQKYLLLARPVTIELKPNNLSQIVNEVVESFKEEFEKSGVKFKLEFHDDPQIELSSDLVRQAIMNLIINSKDAMGQGGIILISLKLAERKKKKYLALEVTDTGKGISKKELKKIFEPFYTTKKSGSGLGLYIVRRIMEEHNGIVEVSSVEKIGTSFVLLFPLNRGEK
ncbi:MAG: two-component system sensor histidine kinase NtrB, partial [bacterium]